MYFVWRRNDGYINASMSRPMGWTQPSDGQKVTFEILGEFSDFKDAKAFITKNKLEEERQLQYKRTKN